PLVPRVGTGALDAGAVQSAAPMMAISEGKSSTATFTVTLVPVASVAVAPATASIRVGQTAQLTATPQDSAGSTLTGRMVTWASGDTSVARVSPSGQVTGVAQGSATMTAT